MGYNATGYKAYKEASVKTASQGKLVVMLYEEAVKQLENSIEMIDDGNKIEATKIENFGNALQKVEDIITELEVSLDMERGGEIAKNLMSLYVFFNKQLLEATISHDKKIITSIKDQMATLRDAWIQAANSTANTEAPMPQDRPSLNITG